MPRDDIDAGQQALIASSTLPMVRLVKLTTYVDRDAKQGPTSFYFSDKPVTYDYMNEGIDREFWAILAGVAEDELSVIHVPDPRDLNPYQSGLTLNFSNFEVNGRAAYTLLAEQNLHGADIEYAEIAVDPMTVYPVDLTALDGDEHTVIFEGVVIRPGRVTKESFQLQCSTAVPSLSDFWIYATDDSVSLTDFGKRFPAVYGQAKKVPCITYDIGAATTLAVDLEPEFEDYDVLVMDATRFPSTGTFNVLFNEEDVLCSFTDATHLHIESSGREQNSTTARFLKAGAAIEEVTLTAIFVAAGHESSAVHEAYLRNVFAGTLFRVTSDYTVNLRDSTSVPGEVVTSVTFTQDELTIVSDAMRKEARQLRNQAEYGEYVPSFLETRLVDLATFPTVMPYGISPSIGWARDHGVTTASFRSVDDGSSTQDRAASFHYNFSTSDYTAKRIRLVVVFTYASCLDAVTLYFTGKVLGKELTWDSGDISKTVDFAAGAPNAVFEVVTSDWFTLDPEDLLTLEDTDQDAAQTAPLQDNFWQMAADFDGTLGGGGSIITQITDGAGNVTGWHAERSQDLEVTLTNPTKIISGGFPLQLFADIDGYKAPGDSLTPGGAVTVIDDMESTPASNWVSTDLTDADESTIVFEGSGSLKLTSGASATFSTYLDTGAEDWTDEGISFRCYMEAAMHQALLDADTAAAFLLVVSSDTGAVTNLKKFEIPLAEIIPDRWVELQISVNDVENEEVGTLVIGSVDSIGFEFIQDAATAGRVCYIDKLERAPSDRVYSVAHGALMEHPVDVLAHWIQEVGGEVINRAARATALANLGSNIIAGDARAAGFYWDEIAQEFAYSMRSNLVPVQTANGREWAPLTPNAAYKFPAPTKLLTAHQPLVNSGRSLSEFFTDSLHRYGYDASLGSGEEAYASVVTANPQTSDVSTSAADIETVRKAIGSTQAAPAFFRFIQDEDTAKDVAGYYVQEALAYQRGVFDIPDLEWSEGYDAQAGDIAWIIPEEKQLGADEQIASLDGEASDWADVLAGDAIDESAIFREGTGSLELHADGSNVKAGVKNEGNIAAISALDRAVGILVNVPSATLSNLISIHIRVASGADVDTDYKEWEFLAAQFTADTWLRIRAQLDGSESSSSGTLDPTHILHYQLDFIQDSATADEGIYFDDMQIMNQRTPVRLIKLDKNRESFHSDLVAVQVETV